MAEAEHNARPGRRTKHRNLTIASRASREGRGIRSGFEEKESRGKCLGNLISRTVGTLSSLKYLSSPRDKPAARIWPLKKLGRDFHAGEKARRVRREKDQWQRLSEKRGKRRSAKYLQGTPTVFALTRDAETLAKRKRLAPRMATWIGGVRGPTKDARTLVSGIRVGGDSGTDKAIRRYATARPFGASRRIPARGRGEAGEKGWRVEEARFTAVFSPSPPEKRSPLRFRMLVKKVSRLKRVVPTRGQTRRKRSTTGVGGPEGGPSKVEEKWRRKAERAPIRANPKHDVMRPPWKKVRRFCPGHNGPAERQRASHGTPSLSRKTLGVKTSSSPRSRKETMPPRTLVNDDLYGIIGHRRGTSVNGPCSERRDGKLRDAMPPTYDVDAMVTSKRSTSVVTRLRAVCAEAPRSPGSGRARRPAVWFDDYGVPSIFPLDALLDV
ncbi:hypothetical protein KM043_007352 [Ampulex compressa]|nr:hypothetical protein KM043_007352 [Ampulex compressa]